MFGFEPFMDLQSDSTFAVFSFWDVYSGEMTSLFLCETKVFVGVDKFFRFHVAIFPSRQEEMRV
jgi:hypothetical protein